MKLRSTSRRNWPRVPRHRLELKDVGPYTLVHLHALTVTEPLRVTCCGERLTVIDTGYHWLTLLEPGVPHVTTLHCDAAGQLVQVYVDMIEGWSLGEDGYPVFDDLYLDVIALPDGRAEIIDVEELEEALEAGAITRAQFDAAWSEATGVLEAIRQRRFAPLRLNFLPLIAHVG